MAASVMSPNLEEPHPGLGTAWHTLRVRVRVFSALVLLAVLTLVASSRAQTSASARARAAVVTGTLGTVAAVKAHGDEAASRSAPSTAPGGILLDGGSASVTSARGGGNASASAEAAATG